MESARCAALSSQNSRPQGDVKENDISKQMYEPLLENGDIHHFVPILFQLRFRHLALVTVRYDELDFCVII